MNDTEESRSLRPDRSSGPAGAALGGEAREARSRSASLAPNRNQPESTADLPADRFIPRL